MRRRRTIAVFLSSLFPGLGQLYNRQRGKAALFAIGAILAAYGPLSPVDVDIDLGNPAAALRSLILASLPFLVVAIWSVIDAYQNAAQSS